MDEIQEAQDFSEELDKVLSGQSGGSQPAELAKDLALAAKLSRMDLSGESRVKQSLRAKLVPPQKKPAAVSPVRKVPPFLSWTARPRVLAGSLAAVLAVLVVIPMGVHFYMSSSFSDEGVFGAGISTRSSQSF